MCRIHQKVYFYKCAHVQEYDFPSVNENCPKEVCEESVNFSDKCPFCERGRGWAETFRIGRPCGGFTGQVITRYQIPSHVTEYETASQLWNQRRAVVAEYQKYKSKARAAYAAERQNEDALKSQDEFGGSSDKIQKYWIDDTTADNPLLQRLSEEEAAKIDDRCIICLADFEADEEDGRITCATSGGACKLPCGHIFGGGCLRELFEAGAPNFLPTDGEYKQQTHSCPMCRREFEVFHDNASMKFEETGMRNAAMDLFRPRGFELAAKIVITFLLLPVIFLVVYTTTVPAYTPQTGEFNYSHRRFKSFSEISLFSIFLGLSLAVPFFWLALIVTGIRWFLKGEDRGRLLDVPDSGSDNQMLNLFYSRLYDW